MRLCVTNRILSLNQNKKKHTSLHHAWISHRANGAAAPIITGGWYACSLHIVLRVLARDRLCWKLQPRQERGQKGPLRTVWTDFTVNAKSVRPLFFLKVYCVILISFRFMIASETCWYVLFAIRNLKPKMERQHVLLLPHYLDFNIVHLHFPLIPTRDIFQYEWLCGLITSAWENKAKISISDCNLIPVIWFAVWVIMFLPETLQT